MKEAPWFEGAFLVSATHPIGKAPGVGYLAGRGIGSRSVKVLVFAGGFFFGNTVLSLELWTVICGISGFDN